MHSKSAAPLIERSSLSGGLRVRRVAWPGSRYPRPSLWASQDRLPGEVRLRTSSPAQRDCRSSRLDRYRELFAGTAIERLPEAAIVEMLQRDSRVIMGA